MIEIVAGDSAQRDRREATALRCAAEIAAKFAANQSLADFGSLTCPALAETARELFVADGESEHNVHEMIYFAALFRRSAIVESRDWALLVGGLAFLLCHFTPDLDDIKLIQQGNPESKLLRDDSKKVRDTWAFMNFKRAMSADPRISYTAKSGWKMRAEFQSAAADAMEYSINHWKEFQKFALFSRAEQLGTRLLGSPTAKPDIPDLIDYVSETVPDGSLFPFNASFTKSWIVRNAGRVPWIGRSMLRLTPHSPLFPRTPETAPVPTTFPGEIATISIDVLTTRVTGFSEVRFKMIEANGAICWPDAYAYGMTFVIETLDFTPRSLDRV